MNCTIALKLRQIIFEYGSAINELFFFLVLWFDITWLFSTHIIRKYLHVKSRSGLNRLLSKIDLILKDVSLFKWLRSSFTCDVILSLREGSVSFDVSITYHSGSIFWHRSVFLMIDWWLTYDEKYCMCS